MTDYWKSVALCTVGDRGAQPGTVPGRPLSVTSGKMARLPEKFQRLGSVMENIKVSVKHIMRVGWQISGKIFRDVREDVEEILAEKVV